MKVLTLRRPDVCAGCAAGLPAGTQAGWDAQSRTVRCLECGGAPFRAPACQATYEEPQPSPRADTAVGSALVVTSTSAMTGSPLSADGGALGASAQREYERRAKRREDRVRARHPRLGGLILALSDAPVSTRVWAQGAAGEGGVAAKADALPASTSPCSTPGPCGAPTVACPARTSTTSRWPPA